MIEKLLEYIPQIIQYFAGLFTSDEWKALLVLVFATLAGTHFAKIVWRLIPWTAGGARSLINLFALIIGVGFAYPIWRTMAHDNIPWYIAGVIAALLSVLLFKFLISQLKKYAPEIARALNGDRRRPGDRRHKVGVAPGGAPERREADRRKS